MKEYMVTTKGGGRRDIKADWVKIDGDGRLIFFKGHWWPSRVAAVNAGWSDFVVREPKVEDIVNFTAQSRLSNKDLTDEDKAAVIAEIERVTGELRARA